MIPGLEKNLKSKDGKEKTKTASKIDHLTQQPKTYNHYDHLYGEKRMIRDPVGHSKHTKLKLYVINMFLIGLLFLFCSFIWL